MIVIGITGGIGTGKTTASDYLEEQGFAVIDADQIGRELTADGQPILAEIRDRFGCVTDGGAEGNGLVLDRKAMADLVFNNKEIKEEYDQLIHAEIIEEIDREIEELSKTDVKGILLDAPLLFEAGLEALCDTVWCVWLPKELQLKRLMERDGLSRKEAEKRVASQMPPREKKRRSDLVIDTRGTREESAAFAEQAYRAFLSRTGENQTSLEEHR